MGGMLVMRNPVLTVAMTLLTFSAALNCASAAPQPTIYTVSAASARALSGAYAQVAEQLKAQAPTRDLRGYTILIDEGQDAITVTFFAIDNSLQSRSLTFSRRSPMSLEAATHVAFPAPEAEAVVRAYDAWNSGQLAQNSPPSAALQSDQFYVTEHIGNLTVGPQRYFVAFVPSMPTAGPVQPGCGPIKNYTVNPSTLEVKVFPQPC